jgi:hypothetical protein
MTFFESSYRSPLRLFAFSDGKPVSTPDQGRGRLFLKMLQSLAEHDGRLKIFAAESVARSFAIA